MGCTQEISSFNPTPCQYDFFEIYRADEVRKFNTGRNSYIGGAIEELNKIPNLESIYTYHAEGSASGPLEHSAFLKIVEEFLEVGVDVITTGNHVWDQKEAIEFISLEIPLYCFVRSNILRFRSKAKSKKYASWGCCEKYQP